MKWSWDPLNRRLSPTQPAQLAFQRDFSTLLKHRHSSTANWSSRHVKETFCSSPFPRTMFLCPPLTEVSPWKTTQNPPFQAAHCTQEHQEQPAKGHYLNLALGLPGPNSSSPSFEPMPSHRQVHREANRLISHQRLILHIPMWKNLISSKNSFQRIS